MSDHEEHTTTDAQLRAALGDGLLSQTTHALKWLYEVGRAIYSAPVYEQPHTPRSEGGTGFISVELSTAMMQLGDALTCAKDALAAATLDPGEATEKERPGYHRAWVPNHERRAPEPATTLDWEMHADETSGRTTMNDEWEPGIGSAQIKADSDAQEARQVATDDSIRAYIEDFIDYGVSIGKFASRDDAPDIDAWLETLDELEGYESPVLQAADLEGKALPQNRAVIVTDLPPLRHQR